MRLQARDDATVQGMERWLYLTQALQTRCVGGSFSAYRQHSEVYGALNWAINSIWLGPAWGSISYGNFDIMFGSFPEFLTVFSA